MKPLSSAGHGIPVSFFPYVESQEATPCNQKVGTPILDRMKEKAILSLMLRSQRLRLMKQLKASESVLNESDGTSMVIQRYLLSLPLFLDKELAKLVKSLVWFLLSDNV